MTPEKFAGHLNFEVLPARQKALWKAIDASAEGLEKSGFYLAGGTALALQLGHRESVDFDFFSRQNGTGPLTRKWLDKNHPASLLREADKDTVHADLKGVKVSFIGAYKYPHVGRFVVSGHMRLANVADIALMKLLAVTHRAAMRDYIDLAAILSSGWKLDDLLRASKKKYGRTFNTLLPMRALVSFDDLEPEIPRILDARLKRTWRDILTRAVAKASL